MGLSGNPLRRRHPHQTARWHPGPESRGPDTAERTLPGNRLRRKM